LRISSLINSYKSYLAIFAPPWCQLSYSMNVYVAQDAS